MYISFPMPRSSLHPLKRQNTPLHLGFVIKSSSSFGSNSEDEDISSYNSFPSFSVRVNVYEKEIRKDTNYQGKEIL